MYPVGHLPCRNENAISSVLAKRVSHVLNEMIFRMNVAFARW